MTKILIVEDDEWLAQQQKRVLASAGYEIKLAYHALDAIKFVDEFKPDVLILDILLTGVTAFNLMNELQSYRDTGALPVILCTNLAREFKLSDLEPYGVKRVVDKTTMLPEDLIGAVKAVL